MSVTYSLCLLQTFSVCQRQLVSVRDSLDLSQTVYVSHNLSASVRHCLCRSHTVCFSSQSACVSQRQSVSVRQSVSDFPKLICFTRTKIGFTKKKLEKKCILEGVKEDKKMYFFAIRIKNKPKLLADMCVPVSPTF